MKSIQEILNRIRWDKDYANADFTIGYYDRMEDRLILAPFRELSFDEEDHFCFQLVDEEGVTHSIPFHRIKQLYKNGECIWQRDV